MTRRTKRTSTHASVVKRPVKKKNVRWLKKLFLFIIVVGLAVWLGASLYYARLRITKLPAASTHSFITTSQTTATILLVSQGNSPANLRSLQVLQPNMTQHRLVALNLPASLADQDTTAGQYVESGYYKELQQLVEQTLAVPLSDYIVLSRQSSHGQTLNLQWLKAHATWWNLTIGLPWTLRNLPDLHTSLSAKDLWQLAWYLRAENSQQLEPQSLPAKSLIPTTNRVQVDSSKSDPFVAQQFADPAIKQQNTSIVIKNATTTAGLATIIGRFVTNMGGTVVAVEPSDQPNAAQSTMTSDHASALSQALTSFLGLPLTVQSPTGRERADIELIVGSDILNRLGQ